MTEPADTVRDIVDALHYLKQAVQAVKSTAMGGQYEDLPIWDIEQCLARLDARIDGDRRAGG